MGDSKPSGSTGANWPAVVVVLIVVAAIVAITWITIDKYASPKDVATVLGLVITPLGGIGAAAFGIKFGADAKAETKQVKNEAKRIADRTRSLRTQRAAGAEEGVAAPDPLEEIENDLRNLGD